MFSKENELTDDEDVEADIIDASVQTAEKEPVSDLEIMKEDVHD